MDKPLTLRAVILGHSILTLPAAAAIVLVPFWGLGMFGASKFVYYVLGAMALGWQWCYIILPSWKRWLLAKHVPAEDVDLLARRAGFAWLVDSALGPFAFHTTAAAVCGLHLGAWLLSRWYVWLMPLSGMPRHVPTANDWLQHFEATSIVPALVAGYFLSRHWRRLASYAWVVPTVIVAYKLLAFTEPQVSIFAPRHPSVRWEYFFVIQRTMPTFTPGFGGVDPVRVAEQLTVIAPFYSGLAYSAGAIVGAHDLLKRIFGNSRLEAEAEPIQTGENATTSVADEQEKPATELN
jgi:hypothetical protein